MSRSWLAVGCTISDTIIKIKERANVGTLPPVPLTQPNIAYLIAIWSLPAYTARARAKLKGRSVLLCVVMRPCYCTFRNVVHEACFRRYSVKKKRQIRV